MPPAINNVAIAVALGMDAMSVCVALGVRWHGRGQKLRLACTMGLFQFLMPVIGWLVGRQFAALLRSVGTYVAAAIVLAVGAKMLYEALKKGPGSVAIHAEHAVEEKLYVKFRRGKPRDPTLGWSLLALSLATSVDAMVVGISLGLKGRTIWQASMVIGIVAAAMALLGVMIGKRMRKAMGSAAEIVGAVILMVLGICFLWI